MAAPTEEINSILVEQIKNFSTAVETREVGTVVQVGDGIARVYGLGNVGALELVEFTKQDVMGIALNLEEESVGVMVVGPYTEIEEGDEVRRTGQIASVPGRSRAGRAAWSTRSASRSTARVRCQPRWCRARRSDRPARGAPLARQHAGPDRASRPSTP